jgi:hypothetical protein
MLVSAGDRIVGCLSVRRTAVPWTDHSREVSIAIAPGWPSIELAEHLWRALMAAVAPLQLRKLVALIMLEQAGERAALEHLGFFVEGLLADQVIDPAGRTYDLLIMAHPLPQSFVLRPEDRPAVLADGSPAVAPNRSVAIVEVARSVIPTSAPRFDSPLPVTGDPREDGPRRAGRSPWRPGRQGRAAARAPLVAALLTLVLVLVGGLVYLWQLPSVTNESQVLGQSAIPAQSASSFSLTQTGAGAVFLPPIRPAMTVQVALEPATSGESWFWCVESSVGIPFAEHHCGSAGSVRQGETGDLITGAVVHIDASWPADARYFVAMYCQGSCVWHLSVTAEAQAAAH